MHLHLNVVNVPPDLQMFIRLCSLDLAELDGIEAVLANSYYTKQGIALVQPIVMEIYQASMTSTTAAE